MALREYYAEHRKTSPSADHEALREIREILSDQAESDSSKVQEIAQVTNRGVRAEDEWALEYITISHVQPLLEAFDDDASTLVSVTEVNAFANARPNDWRYAYHYDFLWFAKL